VRFLVDANLSPRIVEWLRSNGHDAVHAFELGLAAARDREILEHAARGGWIVLTSDLDFGDIAALGGGGSLHGSNERCRKPLEGSNELPS
jgi:predicted nuclease of predicted toxin-antitoxin system